MAGAALIAALALAGCASQGARTVSEDSDVTEEADKRVTQQKVVLSDGSEAYCLFYRLEMECWPIVEEPE